MRYLANWRTGVNRLNSPLGCSSGLASIQASHAAFVTVAASGQTADDTSANCCRHRAECSYGQPRARFCATNPRMASAIGPASALPPIAITPDSRGNVKGRRIERAQA